MESRKEMKNLKFVSIQVVCIISALIGMFSKDLLLNKICLVGLAIMCSILLYKVNKYYD